VFPEDELTASAGQARVPKGNPNGGEWKDTPSSALAQARSAIGGSTWLAPSERPIPGSAEDDGVDLAGAAYGPKGKPRTYAEMADSDDLVKTVNPGVNEDHGDMNCQRVVMALEMRARGYDVVAPPATGDDGTYTQIAARWQTRDGATPEFGGTHYDLDDAMMFQRRNPGARLFATGDDETGAGHIWNIEVGQNGEYKSYDAQTNIELWPELYHHVSVLRVDTLIPTEAMWSREDATSRNPQWVMTTKQFESGDRGYGK
jgi:hypothetical protein